MISLLLVTVGALVTLIGIGLLAPQVRIHAIDGASWQALLFRTGAAILNVGQVIGLLLGAEPTLFTVGLVMGGAILFASIIILTHERRQASYTFRTSLSLSVFITGMLVSILALAGQFFS